MFLIWISYFFEIILLSILKPIVTDFSVLAILATIIHVIITTIILLSFNIKVKNIIIWAFLIRILFLFFDIFGRDILILPHSGSDTELFYNSALEVSTTLGLTLDSSVSLYSKITGLIFKFIGPMRIFVQYLNVLLGISTIYILYIIFDKLNINENIKYYGTLIYSFMPISIIMSSIFLREAFPTFFVSLSVLFFTDWINNSNKGNMITSLIMLAIASAFHSGVIGIALGLAFAYLFYNAYTNQLIFSKQTIVYSVILSFLTFIALTYFNGTIFGKFQGIDNTSELFDKSSGYGAASSVYLAGLKINNFFNLIIFAPIKAIYFYLSPLPWNWRGLSDLITFFIDSVFYLGSLIYYFYYKNRYLDSRKNVVNIFLLMIIGSGLIFGLGVDNAGTAMRHRQKLLPVFIPFLISMLDSKIRFNSVRKVNNIILDTEIIKEDKMNNYNQWGNIAMFSEFLNIFKKNIFKMLIGGITGLIISSFITFFIMKPQYSSTADLVVSEPASQEMNLSTIQTNFSLLNTYEGIIKKTNVLEQVIEDTGINMSVDELYKATTVNTEENSLLLSINVTAESPYEAAELANSISENFVNEVQNTLQVNNVFIWNYAVPNTSPISPNIPFNLFVGILLGISVVIFYLIIKHISDTSVKSENIIASMGLTTLGIVPLMSESVYRETVLNENFETKVKSSKRRIR